MAYNTFHLFAGAGGGILADLLLGHIPVGACEIEEYPRKVLLQRQRDGILPEFPIWDDIRTLDGRPWRGLVDVVCGGFPCQDISSAGNGAGIDGERSGLWREMARVIGEIRPRRAFVENSPLLVGRGLAVVLGDFAEMGYDARWCVLGSDDVGGIHHRKRMWLLAYPKIMFSNERKNRHGIPVIRKKKPELRNNNVKDLVTNPNGIGQQEQGGAAQYVNKAEDFYRKTNIPFNDSSGRTWPISKSVLCGGNDGLACSMDRLKAIGNGQDPRVAATAWRILV